ncbi:MAG: DUF456 domain-containing protein [Candidatus Abyssobacteria bacterium SURF_17]|uniref:DUF456 domain-containing protein n=1 Tax=Candidatus Abyssobacteria bacterium SURF_17 TaxID=2093361 RepID=A0A419F621_9BACT|nr:MAG: DUF456 domain-containing protein [Candidatus Abyssubacteria bacterium SURF_17]
MDTLLAILGYGALGVCMLIGLAITPLGLPGNWIVFGCAIAYGFATGWTKFGWLFIILLGVAALVGELIEALSSAAGAKKYGASTGGTVAAIVGSIAGLILGSAVAPIVGSLVGAFLGAFGGAFLYEYARLKDRRQAFRAGVGALLGRTAAVLLKEAIGVLMVGLLVYQFFT